MEAKKPTLEDVGRAAGVSRATASRVITGGRRVSANTRDRVWQAVETLGYHPDLAARALAKGRADVIDLVIIDEDATQVGSNPYYSRVVSGILSALAGSDTQMRTHVIDEPEAPTRLDDVAHIVGVGALLINVPPDLAARFTARCDRVVSLGRSARGVPVVEAENVAGARAAVEHLYRTGRRKVVAVHGKHGNSCATARRNGFSLASVDAGHEPIGAEGGFCLEAGVAGTKELLAAHPDLDGIFAACDLTAMGVLRALNESGRRVPDDVALVGFDDSFLASVATPAMTSVRQPVEHMAALATRALLAGETGPSWHRVEPAPLQIRRSSAA
ncbi:LacI family DNA-binding transcriptional regulator [Asanoa sp. WMMD1127]|uniref:LacI family DNA-binding transcriptional regulator n=1 Tax=Asanoa sp. WMMD1127 TaxID=3016107 RepID=UPI002416CD2B|nr:LacI family DNA-binding transcriptional regulator [Asanoa sp. WMMD1127]MDG4822475.1 LacI family DNA-binding transcriptional regulator [Asanoa sp. WMMD1127]